MKKILSIILIIVMLLGIVLPVTVHADELYTIDIELQVDPRIKADKVPVMVKFCNEATGEMYGASITYQTNYHGTIKVPSGNYVLVEGAVGNDFDCIYDFPFWTEYEVNGINTKWTVQVGDVNYDGPINKNEDGNKEQGFIDYEEMYGMTEEEYKEYLEKIEQEMQKENEENELSSQEDYHKLKLVGEFNVEEIHLTFNEQKVVFFLDKGYEAEVFLTPGEYEIDFVYASGRNEFGVITEKINVIDDKGTIEIELKSPEKENQGNEEITNPDEPTVPGETTPGGNGEEPQKKVSPVVSLIIIGAFGIGCGVIIYLRRKNSNFEE